MIALDTNVLARYLLADAGTQYWIPVTVVLELAWVLRESDAPRAVIMERLRDLLSFANVRAQNAEAVFQALRWAAQGMDLADTLHLVMSGKAERFATFDEALVRQTRKLGALPPVSMP